jgi:hypothetical protein
MKNEITIKEIDGKKIIRMRGGRSSSIIDNKKKYNRKRNKDKNNIN